MSKMTTQEVLQKLEKLRAFAERDCGNETENAIRIINRLRKEYKIIFLYKTFVQKQAEERAQRQAEQKQREEDASREREMITESVTISHISSKDITIALCRKMKIPYCVKGWKVWVKCEPAQLRDFYRELYRVKDAWKCAVERASREIIREMENKF